MFGMGFTEILMIAIVAILFLGPDKLPDAMVQVGKFIRSFKKVIDDAKSTFEEEVHLKELKEEAMQYRETLQKSSEDISGFKNALNSPVEEAQRALNEINLDPQKVANESMGSDLSVEYAQKRASKEKSIDGFKNSGGSDV